MKKWSYAAIAAVIAACLFCTLSYDVYSYHIWAYKAASDGITSIYDKAGYFDRYLDYPPVGAYTEILSGKIISLFSPMRIASIPLLPLYKTIPAAALVMIMLMFASAPFRRREQILLALLFLPTLFAVSCTGQTESAVLLLLFYGLACMEKEKIEMASFVFSISVLMKQTAVFFVFALFLFYLLRSKKRGLFALKSISVFASVIFISFIPFIIEGKLLETLGKIYRYTAENAGTLSVYAFNALSAVPGAYGIDINSKLFALSYKSISLSVIIISAVILASALKKGGSLRFAALFSLIWYNAAVGMKSQHIIYPLFFLTLAAADSKMPKRIPALFSILALINMAASESALTMALFGKPSMGGAFYILFSFLQTALSAAAAIYLIKDSHSFKFASKVKIIHGLKTPASALLLSVFVLAAAYLPARIDRGEREFMSSSIRRGGLAEYSADRYIDLNIYSPSPFRNYLAVRMSDGSFFKMSIPSHIKSVSFKLKAGYSDAGAIEIDGRKYSCSNKEMRVLHYFLSDTSDFKASAEGLYGQIVLYDIHYEGEGM